MAMDDSEKNVSARRRPRHQAVAGIKRAAPQEGVCRTAALLNAALRLWEAKNGQKAARSAWTRTSEASI